MMSTPLILTNFKTYESAVGAHAVSLAKIHESVAQETGITFAVAVQTADIFPVCQSVRIPVFAQHCDGIGYGSHTGHVLAETLVHAGATGVILNHSEHRFMNHNALAEAILRAQSVGLTVCVCAESATEGAEIAQKHSPDFIAVEPPELIGGDISVATAQPELISDSVQHISPSAVLVGAGIKNAEDVRVSLKLGSKGVLLASGVTKAKNPREVLMNLASGCVEGR